MIKTANANRARVRRFIQRLLPNVEPTTEDSRKRFLVIAFLKLGIPVLGAFTIHDFSASLYFDAIMDLLIFAVLVGAHFALDRAKHELLVYRACIVALTIYLIFILANTKDSAAEIYWLFILPLLCAYILGKKEGIAWSASIGIIAAAVLLIRPMSGYVFSRSSIIRFAIAYLLIGIMSLLFESVRERTFLLLEKERAALKDSFTTIKEISVRDHLTGLYNRAYMGEQLQHEVRRHLRYDAPVSIVLCDIDSFKHINDTYGHPVGDEVLKETANAILSTVREGLDWVVRFGGEEFLIVLPQTREPGAAIAAERIRRAIEELRITASGDEIRITASFGVSEFGGRCSDIESTIASTISTADAALYLAKQQGKNRVCVPEGNRQRH